MNMTSKFVFIIVIILFTFTGCASRQVRPTETGFLSSYTDLKENKDLDGMYIYKNSDVNIAG